MAPEASGDLMDFENARAFADTFWEERILPALSEYIRIPVLSRAFDPDWETNGHTDRALALVLDWLEGNRPEGTKVRVGKVPGRTPVLLVEIPGSSDDTVLGRKFPEAPFLITGVLGPESNAHGPNEFLEIEYAKKLTAAVSSIIEGYSRRNR